VKSNKIRYGIIGFGLFSERTIAPAIQNSPNSELVAIQKRSLTAAREKAALFKIPHAFSSVDELVRCSEVDAVFIGSANSAHHDETIAAARARKHVLVEKPMATNAADAERMVKTCEEFEVKLMVGHVFRFSPIARDIQTLVQSGQLGQVISARADYMYDSRLSHRRWLYDRVVAGGGPVFDVGVHCLDALCFVLDDHVRSVKSYMSPWPTDTSTERSAILNLEFSKGTLASISCSFQSPTRRSFIEIMGTEGVASAEDFTMNDRRLTLHVGIRTDGTALKSEDQEVIIPNLYIEEITAFSKCILDNTESPVPGTVGLHHQKVLDLALRGGGVISQS
jgi:predicted dehydrogenase